MLIACKTYYVVEVRHRAFDYTFHNNPPSFHLMITISIVVDSTKTHLENTIKERSKILLTFDTYCDEEE